MGAWGARRVHVNLAGLGDLRPILNLVITFSYEIGLIMQQTDSDRSSQTRQPNLISKNFKLSRKINNAENF